jgi:hypothetical protein
MMMTAIVHGLSAANRCIGLNNRALFWFLVHGKNFLFSMVGFRRINPESLNPGKFFLAKHVFMLVSIFWSNKA